MTIACHCYRPALLRRESRPVGSGKGGNSPLYPPPPKPPTPKIKITGLVVLVGGQRERDGGVGHAAAIRSAICRCCPVLAWSPPVNSVFIAPIVSGREEDQDRRPSWTGDEKKKSGTFGDFGGPPAPPRPSPAAVAATANRAPFTTAHRPRQIGTTARDKRVRGARRRAWPPPKRITHRSA